MELTRHIPEFLPIDGHRVRFHYGGIPKQCLNCYGWGHMRSECTYTKVTWIEYVENFVMKEKNLRDINLDERLLGRCSSILEKRKLEREKESSKNEHLTFVSQIRSKTSSDIELTDDSSESETENGNKTIATSKTNDDVDVDTDTASVAELAAKFDKKTKKTKSPPTTRSKGKTKTNKKKNKNYLVEYLPWSTPQIRLHQSHHNKQQTRYRFPTRS